MDAISSNSKGVTTPAAQRNPGDESEPGDA